MVARCQLIGAGFSSSSIDRRITSKQLLPVFPGVYALGTDALSQLGWWMAGVLASGPGTVLSHRTAGAHWGITDPGPRIETTRAFGLEPLLGFAPGCRIPRLRIHRTRTLPPAETVVRSGIPVMSLERTLLSLAAVLAPRRLESAYVRAEHSRALDYGALRLVLQRGSGWKGIGSLRRLASQGAACDPRTKSVLEDSFLLLCQRVGIPKPMVNGIVEGIEVDCCWSKQKLIVELDGFRFHSDQFSFERDRARDAELSRHGYRVLRFTYRQVTKQPTQVAETVAELLSTSSSNQRATVPVGDNGRAPRVWSGSPSGTRW